MINELILEGAEELSVVPDGEAALTCNRVGSPGISWQSPRRSLNALTIRQVGNHEFYDGDQLTRYLNQTYGVTMAGNTRAEGADGTSTATSPLG